MGGGGGGGGGGGEKGEMKVYKWGPFKFSFKDRRGEERS